jgi:serine/threonine-protein kinase
MAQVYAARLVGEAGFARLVAIKRMLPNLTEEDAFVAMFLDEGRIAAAIDSAHVVSTLDLARAESGEPYMVMELVIGASLAQLARGLGRAGQPIPIDVAVDVIAQAAGGLQDAHEARTPLGVPLEIVHRDVSPQNVLVDVGGRARLSDFGIARAVERATRTETGQLKGKFGYVAPEQIDGASYGREVDIWSLGIVAWEVIAGRRLFGGRAPTETLSAIANEVIPRLDSVRSDVSPELAAVIARALERDPAARWPSALAFQRALRLVQPPADPQQVGALVRTYARETVERLEGQLRSASGERALDLARSGTNSLDAAVPIHVELDATRRPASLPRAPASTPVTPAPQPKARFSRRHLTLAGALGVALLLLAALAWGRTTPAPVQPVATPIQVVAEEPEPEQVAELPTALDVPPATEEAPTAPAAPPSVVERPRRRARVSRASEIEPTLPSPPSEPVRAPGRLHSLHEFDRQVPP